MGPFSDRWLDFGGVDVTWQARKYDLLPLRLHVRLFVFELPVELDFLLLADVTGQVVGDR